MENSPTSQSYEYNAGNAAQNNPNENVNAFPPNTVAVLESIFESFFKKLKDTPIKINSGNSGNAVDPIQEAEFEKRSNVISGYRGSYLKINSETSVNIFVPTTKTPIRMDLDKYIHPTP